MHLNNAEVNIDELTALTELTNAVDDALHATHHRPTPTQRKATAMFTSIHPQRDLAEIREHHAHLRRQAEAARLGRATRHRHRFRSRQRSG